MNKITCLLISILMLPAFIISGGSSYGETADSQSAVYGPGVDYVPNQVIAVFAKDVTRADMNKIVSFCLEDEGMPADRNRYSLTEIETDNNAVLITLSDSVNVEKLARDLKKNPDVLSGQLNYIYMPSSSGSTLKQSANDGKGNYDSKWHLEYTDAPRAWKLIEDLRKTGQIDRESEAVTVASLDMGASTEHKAISSMLLTDDCVSTVYEQDSKPSFAIKKYGKPTGHQGTAAAGVIASVAGRDSKAVEIMAINVFKVMENPSGTDEILFTTSADAVSGIDYACRHNARIITMGFGHKCGNKSDSRATHGDKLLESKIGRCSGHSGTMFVTAAGDAGIEDQWYPSDYKNCISVINTNRYTDATSSKCRNKKSNYGVSKQLSAPGTGIVSADRSGGYNSFTGTAYSASAVAAAAAMVMYAEPELEAEEVADILYSSATDLYKKGFDKYTGYGNVNVYRALVQATGPDGIKTKDNKYGNFEDIYRWWMRR